MVDFTKENSECLEAGLTDVSCLKQIGVTFCGEKEKRSELPNVNWNTNNFASRLAYWDHF